MTELRESSVAPGAVRAPSAVRVELAHIFRRGYAAFKPGIAQRRRSPQVKRHNARPDRQSIVLLIIRRWPGASLRRGFFDRELQHGRGLQLLGGRVAHIFPAAGDQVIGDHAQCLCLALNIIDFARGSESDDGAVVHGVVECGPREHNAIYVRDRDAGRHARGKLSKHPAGGRPVQAKPSGLFRITNAAVERGYHERLTFHAKADMCEKTGVENGHEWFANHKRRVAEAGERLCDRSQCGTPHSC